MLDEQRDVLLALTQRRNHEVDDIEAIEQILAEQSLSDQVSQMAVGRGDDPDVDATCCSPNAPTFCNSPVSRNRSSRPCIRSVISPISSRNTVPP